VAAPRTGEAATCAVGSGLRSVIAVELLARDGLSAALPKEPAPGISRVFYQTRPTLFVK
jgi:hypothetical protein